MSILTQLCTEGVQKLVDNDNFSISISKSDINTFMQLGKNGSLLFSNNVVIKQSLTENNKPAPDTVTYYQVKDLQDNLKMILKLKKLIYSNTKFYHNLDEWEDTNTKNIKYMFSDNKLYKNLEQDKTDTREIYEYKFLEYGDAGDLQKLWQTLISGSTIRKTNTKTGETEYTDINPEKIKEVTNYFKKMLLYLYLVTLTYRIILTKIPDFVHGDLKYNNIFLKKAPRHTLNFGCNVLSEFNKFIVFESKLIDGCIPKFADYGNTPATDFLKSCFPQDATENQTPDTEAYDMIMKNLFHHYNFNSRIMVALTPEMQDISKEIQKNNSIDGFLENINNQLESILIKQNIIHIYKERPSTVPTHLYYLYTDKKPIIRSRSISSKTNINNNSNNNNVSSIKKDMIFGGNLRVNKTKKNRKSKTN
jgi:hypothetical protein